MVAYLYAFAVHRCMRGIMDAPNEPEDMSDTSIRVSEELADELHERKNRGDSYEDVIWRLLEDRDGDSDE